MQLRENLELYRKKQIKKERGNFLKLLSKKNRQYNRLKKPKNLEEDKKSLNFRSITKKLRVINSYMKRCWMNSYNRKQKDNIK
jgi:hypothetical protein